VIGVIVGAAAAIAVALVGTPLLIRFLKAHGVGQPIHEAVTQHTHKAGTPTMGGAIIATAGVLGYVAARLWLGAPPTRDGLLVVAAVVGAAVVGGIDDWLKVRSRRNVGGLSRRAKTALLAPIIVGFAGAHLAAGSCTAIAITRCSTGFDLGPVVWFVFAVGFAWSTTNAVNFADGLEGLLAGSGAVTLTALVLVALWQFRHPGSYDVPNALDLAIVASCVAGACIGFLWWNANPTTVFMGDVGSLAIGTAVATLALTMDVALLVVVLGALYVIEGLSVSLQISTWKLYFKRRGLQRRLFKMAPLHHHYEVSGWGDGTILTRFWIINAIAAAVALGIFYLDALGP
jgi:phospho-N-acetylmuramoyl-pentapeptide-transferase